MKLIVYHSDPAKIQEIAYRLRSEGHEVVGQARTVGHLAHLMCEFDASCVVAGQLPNDLNNQACPFSAGACAASLYQRMMERGHAIKTAPRMWEAALGLCTPREPHELLVARASTAFRKFAVTEPAGLSRLPGAWLAGLPRILGRLSLAFGRGRIPWFFAGIAAKHGMCEIELHQEGALHFAPPGPCSRRFELRTEINLALYPTAWRSLKPRHWAKLHDRFPDLRPLLESSREHRTIEPPRGQQ